MSAPAGAAGRTPALVAGGTAFVLLVAWTPSLASPAFSPRLAVLGIVGAVGLVALVVEARRKRPAAIAGALVVGWAALSALGAGTPLAWTGQYPLGTGAIFVAATLGCWALGGRLDGAGRRGLAAGVVVGALVNAVVAVLQMAVALGIDDLRLHDGRATGLMGNPVFLGAIAAAAVPLVGRFMARRPALAATATGVLAAAVQVSGTRVALAGLALGAVILVVRLRSRRSMAALASMAVLAGVLSGSALVTVAADREPTVSATDRLRPTATASGVQQRLEVWEAGLEASLDRPVLGWGPGRFQEATSSHRTLRLARLAGPGRIFADAHNLAVEHLATTGFVGAALLVAFGGLAGREALRRRRLLWLAAAASLVLFHALEPQNVAVTPLLAAALGAAGAPDAGSPRLVAPSRWATIALGGVAVVAGGLLLAGDAAARVAVLDFDPGAARRSSRLLPMWSAPKNLEARIAVFDAEARDDPSGLARALEATAEAVDREPHDPATLELRAAVLAQVGRTDEAADAYRAVFVANPWSVQAAAGLQELWAAHGDFLRAEACRELMASIKAGGDAEEVSRLRRECAAGR